MQPSEDASANKVRRASVKRAPQRHAAARAKTVQNIQQAPCSVFEDVLVYGDLADMFYDKLVPRPEHVWTEAQLLGWTNMRAITRASKAAFDAKVAALYGCPKSLGVKAQPAQLTHLRNFSSGRPHRRGIVERVHRLQLAMASSKRIAALAKSLATAGLRWNSIEQVSADNVGKQSVMAWMSNCTAPSGGLSHVMQRLVFVDALYSAIARLPEAQATFLMERVNHCPNHYAGTVGGLQMAQIVVNAMQSNQRRDIEYSIIDSARVEDQVTEALLIKSKVFENLQQQLGVTLSDKQLCELAQTSETFLRATATDNNNSELTWSNAFSQKSKILAMSHTLAANYRG